MDVVTSKPGTAPVDANSFGICEFSWFRVAKSAAKAPPAVCGFFHAGFPDAGGSGSRDDGKEAGTSSTRC